MRKYLLSFAVIMMTALAFTACENEENDEDLLGLSKMAFAGSAYMESSMHDVTINFDDYRNGVFYYTDRQDIDGQVVPVEIYAHFTYTLTGNKGALQINTVTAVSPKGVVNEPMPEGKGYLEFTYSASDPSIIVHDDGIMYVLKSAKYRKFNIPTH